MDFFPNSIVSFGAACYRGVTGFGYALIMAIGVFGAVSPNLLVPLILLNDLVLTALILLDRKHGAVDWPVALFLLFFGFFGAVAGGVLAGVLDEGTTRLLIAVVVFAAALVALIHEPPRWLSGRIVGAITSLAVGVLLATFAVGGPLIAVWLLAGGTRRETMRGTLAVFFGAVDLFSIFSRLALGQIDAQLPLVALPYLPMTIAGYYLGHFIGSRLAPKTWLRVGAGGIVLIALAGAFKALRIIYPGLAPIDWI
jgi:uncharacterized protein